MWKVGSAQLETQHLPLQKENAKYQALLQQEREEREYSLRHTESRMNKQAEMRAEMNKQVHLGRSRWRDRTGRLGQHPDDVDRLGLWGVGEWLNEETSPPYYHQGIVAKRSLSTCENSWGVFV